MLFHNNATSEIMEGAKCNLNDGNFKGKRLRNKTSALIKVKRK